ncbi:hypothetical protein GF378_02350, partial [Candidatus Pacearchaeota archaeon]|nr:hypothetical protein [Candidatus Pacearchaeota archaeon]
VTIKTNVGTFSASSPTGKSTGKNEKKPYKKSLGRDIKILKQFSDYFSEEILEKFEDLRRVEDITDRNIGANSLFALESAVLKAMAKEQKKEIWEIISPESKKKKSKSKFPRLIGNVIGGAKHSEVKRKPDFQEFELIPKTRDVEKAFEKNKKAKKEVKMLLKSRDDDFKGKKNDENAWITSLNDKETLDVLEKTGIPMGLDVAASGFYKRKKYSYGNPLLKRTPEEHFSYVSNLVKNFNLSYIEDPFQEEDFESHAKLLEKFPKALVVGDDLTTTNPKRLKKAIEMKAINGIIVKPNQIGSLLKVKDVVDLAKKKNIKTIFSHRSGETGETILADLAFGLGADFFKCGTEGDLRVKKIKRLIKIQKSLK